jgi:hypothetical protein
MSDNLVKRPPVVRRTNVVLRNGYWFADLGYPHASTSLHCGQTRDVGLHRVRVVNRVNANPTVLETVRGNPCVAR